LEEVLSDRSGKRQRKIRKEGVNKEGGQKRKHSFLV
jgi:hypothetical protein